MLKFPELPPVDTFEVAPHRYTWRGYGDPYALPTTWREVKEAAPYKAGEVIYVVDGDGYRRAYIHSLSCDRDYYGDLREFYWVRPETKKGLFAKRAYKAYPGYVQRGYKRAGLAPDIPEGAI